MNHVEKEAGPLLREDHAHGGNEEESFPGENLLNKVGRLTRELHDSLRELGYNKALERAACDVPEAHDRLAYVARMTEDAAQRVLNATELAQPIQEKLSDEAGSLQQQWQHLIDRKLSLDEFKSLVQSTRDYLTAVPEKTRETNSHLHAIMMAQDFQDLTGQVIKRVVEVIKHIEGDLLRLLLENIPTDRRPERPASDSLLNGPVVDPAKAVDVVTDQTQVDDLLESLGF